eukprot:CAMPEP_0182530608 /NCGR_PEP_ID=MMETSP1323-20130603/6035_1 /TAXON_ID=236787 /ORGANISM="Florenciella parvula, Strain RCC1693" /LENGTH=68 /DNA_ID=CAMNT_0024739915 /DNA_START=13 /DNA_END=219 /DNA_ORIENTATION=-
MVDSEADEWDLLGYGVREVDGVTHRPKNYGALPGVSLHCARPEPWVYGRTGAGGAKRVRSTDFISRRH